MEFLNKKCCIDGRLFIPRHKGVPYIFYKFYSLQSPEISIALSAYQKVKRCIIPCVPSYNEPRFDSAGPACVVVNGEMRKYFRIKQSKWFN